METRKTCTSSAKPCETGNTKGKAIRQGSTLRYWRLQVWRNVGGRTTADRNALEEALKDLQEEAAEADKASRQQQRGSWDAWQHGALAGSARAMHRLTRPTEAWQPTTTRAEGGGRTARPQDLLEAEALRYQGLWGGGGAQGNQTATPEEVTSVDRDCLPRASAQ